MISGYGGFVEIGGMRMSVGFWSLQGAVRNAKAILAALRHATRAERRWLLDELQTMRRQKELMKG